LKDTTCPFTVDDSNFPPSAEQYLKYEFNPRGLSYKVGIHKWPPFGSRKTTIFEFVSACWHTLVMS